MIHDPRLPAHLIPATLRGRELLLAVRPGLPEGSQVAPAAALCAELITPDPQERALLLGCGNGALGVALARLLYDGELLLSDSSLLALRAAAATLAANAVANATVSPAISQLPERAGQLDRVVVLAPQARALGRRWLVEAHALLRPGGALTLAGANDQGIRPLIADAVALFGGARVLGYGGGGRVAEAARRETPPPPPAWAAAPGIALGSWCALQTDLGLDRTVELLSLPGIFSYDRIDPGTALLLGQLGDLRGTRVLDVGCGYGAIGLAAALRGAAAVTMIDVDLLAVAAAAANAARHAPGAAALAGDGLELADGRYDLIVSNPPFHTGRRIDSTMSSALIRQARAHLAPGGRLLLVANRFLPYDRLLAEHFAHVIVRADNRQYWVLEGGDPVTR